MVRRPVTEPEPEESSPDQARETVNPEDGPPTVIGQNEAGRQDGGEDPPRRATECNQAAGKGALRKRHPETAAPRRDGVSPRLAEADQEPKDQQGYQSRRQS